MLTVVFLFLSFSSFFFLFFLFQRSAVFKRLMFTYTFSFETTKHEKILYEFSASHSLWAAVRFDFYFVHARQSSCPPGFLPHQRKLYRAFDSQPRQSLRFVYWAKAETTAHLFRVNAFFKASPLLQSQVFLHSVGASLRQFLEDFHGRRARR